MQMPERVNSATATLLPPVVLPSPAMVSMAGPAELPLRPPSLPEQASLRSPALPCHDIALVVLARVLRFMAAGHGEGQLAFMSRLCT